MVRSPTKLKKRATLPTLDQCLESLGHMSQVVGNLVNQEIFHSRWNVVIIVSLVSHNAGSTALSRMGESCLF